MAPYKLPFKIPLDICNLSCGFAYLARSKKKEFKSNLQIILWFLVPPASTSMSLLFGRQPPRHWRGVVAVWRRTARARQQQQSFEKMCYWKVVIDGHHSMLRFYIPL